MSSASVTPSRFCCRLFLATSSIFWSTYTCARYVLSVRTEAKVSSNCSLLGKRVVAWIKVKTVLLQLCLNIFCRSFWTFLTNNVIKNEWANYASRNSVFLELDSVKLRNWMRFRIFSFCRRLLPSGNTNVISLSHSFPNILFNRKDWNMNNKEEIILPFSTSDSVKKCDRFCSRLFVVFRLCSFAWSYMYINFWVLLIIHYNHSFI